jgi:dTDP-4-dehydrorhamnose 3,5-epimerase-like enzyme
MTYEKNQGIRMSNKVKKYFGGIELLDASCNISTIKDGRGGIFSWVPEDDIKEWTMLYFTSNKIRGNHYHPEFTEYFLIVSGTVVLVTRDLETGKDINMIMGSGMCFRTPPGIPHTVYAVTDAVCISFLTKPWDSCKNPIIFEDLV